MERARGGPTVGQRDRDQGPPREQGERERERRFIRQVGRRWGCLVAGRFCPLWGLRFPDAWASPKITVTNTH